MLGKGLESLIPSGGYKKPEEIQPVQQGYGEVKPVSFEQPVYPAVYQPQTPVLPASYPPVYQSQSVPVSEITQKQYIPPSQITAAEQQPAQTYFGYQKPQDIQSQLSPQPSYSEPKPVQTYVEPPVIGSYQSEPVIPKYEADPAYPLSYQSIQESAAIKQQPVAYPAETVNSYHVADQSISQAPQRDMIVEEKRDIAPYLDHSSRGLSDDYSVRQDAVFQIEVEKIFPNPHQPRRYFDEGALNDLANSIREFGIIQPLVVTKVFKETESGTDVSYQLIAGERRLMAAKKVGLRTVPAVIKQVSMDRERLELAIIENIQRENLNPLEAGRSYARLQDEFGLTQREIAIRMGKSRETIANTLRLLNLPSEVQKALEEGKINESHARLLLQVTDQAKQREMFDSILHFKPSVRELKAKLRQNKDLAAGVSGYANPELSSLQSRLEEALGTRVQINDEGEKGKIMISYYSPEELNDLIRKLSGGAMY